MLKNTAILFLFILAFSRDVLAEFEFKCKELERVTVADSGLMTPAFPGRKLQFVLTNDTITGTGVFYHKNYDISHFEDSKGHFAFKAFAESYERQDIFLFSNGQLFHSAIVNYGRTPSIQSEIFTCEKSFNY